jgi:pimeloyl-ACP methyl ester carboxylesterase
MNSTLRLKGDTTVHYWNHHPKKKPTIVFVHGFTGSHDGFQYLVPLLKDYHLIIPDLPGFGISPITADSWTLDGLGRMLADFIEALNLPESPFIVAHSMGTLVATSALRQRPSISNKRLVLISPIPTSIRRLESRSAGKIAGQLQYNIAQHLPVFGKAFTRSKMVSRIGTKLVITTKDRALKKKIYQHHFDNLDHISSVALYNTLFREINRTGIIDFADYLASFEILIINGSHDRVTPLSEQKKLARALGAKLYVIPKVGHLAHYETPSRLAEELTNFLQ